MMHGQKNIKILVFQYTEYFKFYVSKNKW